MGPHGVLSWPSLLLLLVFWSYYCCVVVIVNVNIVSCFLLQSLDVKRRRWREHLVHMTENVGDHRYKLLKITATAGSIVNLCYMGKQFSQ